MVRILKGISGYRGDRTPLRYATGSIVADRPEVESDLVKNGLAEWYDENVPRATAITTEQGEVVTAVVKRGRPRRV